MTSPSAALPARPAGRSLTLRAFDRLRKNRAAMASAVFLVLMAAACIFGPWLSPHPFDRVYPDYVRVPASLDAHPTEAEIEPALKRTASRARAEVASWRRLADGRIEATLTAARPVDERVLQLYTRGDIFQGGAIVSRTDEGRRLVLALEPRTMRFVFGTDGNGRDLLARTLIAGRVSLSIGLLATGVALVIGVLYGAVSGYAGGRVDMVMMRIVDVIYALPFIFFVILLVVFFGRNFVLMFIAVGAVEWLDMARIVRGQTLSLKRQEFVQAAEALGVERGGILKRHILPNVIGPVVVTVTLLVPRVILLESFLSFLGLGVQEPLTSWGVLISEGARAIQGGAWLLLYPSLFLISTLMALNFLGDGLRDAFDPKDR